MPIPNLVNVGQKDLLLPPGIHQATLAEIHAAFVDTSPKYRQRVEVWDRYMQFRSLLAGLVPIDHEYLDGSFVTSRAAPKDVDVSFWVQASAIDGMAPHQEAALAQLQSVAIPTFTCDMYLVTPCVAGDAMYGEFQYWKKRTEEAWRAYSNRAKLIVPGIEKGYIEVVN